MVFFWGEKRRRTVTPGDKSYLIRVSRGKCEYCGGEIIGKGIVPEIHHIVPFASGGSDREHNLIVLCPNCHTRIDHVSRAELRVKIAYRLPKKTSAENPVISVKKEKPKTTATKKSTAKKTTKAKATTKTTTERIATPKPKPKTATTTKKTATKRTTTVKTKPKATTATKKATPRKATAAKSSPKVTARKKTTTKKPSARKRSSKK